MRVTIVFGWDKIAPAAEAETLALILMNRYPGEHIVKPSCHLSPLIPSFPSALPFSLLRPFPPLSSSPYPSHFSAQKLKGEYYELAATAIATKI